MAVNDPPVANAITPLAFNEDTQSVITLSYTDAEADLATSCLISSPTNVTVSTACSCTSGVCSVGVTGTPTNYNGPASFIFTVTANTQTSNSATASDDHQVNDPRSPTPLLHRHSMKTQVITLSYTDEPSWQQRALINPTNVTVTPACRATGGVCGRSTDHR